MTNPAPMAVYQTRRFGKFTYTLPDFTANSSHTVRLHFSENYWTAAGQRVFNVSINGTQVLTNFDIFATAGAQNKAVIKEFTVNADSNGQYAIQFITVINNASVSGIEIVATTPPTPDFSLAATPASQQVVSGSNTSYTATVSAIRADRALHREERTQLRIAVVPLGHIPQGKHPAPWCVSSSGRITIQTHPREYLRSVALESRLFPFC